MNLLPMVTCGTLLSSICCTSTALGEAPKLAPSQTLTVRLLDASGKPVSGAHVGSMSKFWRKFLKREAADKDGFTYIDHRVSDAKGISQINFPADEFQQLAQRRCLVARHAERGLIAVADLSPGMTQAPFDLTLVPECRVSGKLLCTELDKRGRKVGWTNVEIYVGRKRIMWCASEQDGDFHFFLPPGHYRVHSYGTYLSIADQEITVPEGKRELTAALPMAATKFALLQGLPAPELSDIVAWKNSKPLKLSDLRGKCVLLDFWGHWCNPCVQGMPDIFRWHDQLAKEGLVVIGIHVESMQDRPVDSVQRLDERLVSTRKNIWHGRDIPYPVAIARPAQPCPVVEDYGLNGFPTLILIDRRGNLVDTVDDNEAGLALVEKCLAEKASVTAPGRDIR